MADARADIIIDVDTSVGIAEIKALQRQISQLNAQLLSAGTRQAQAAKEVQRNLLNNINATEQFSARVKTITSTTESFTRALESNKMSMGQYFKYAGASTQTFGRLFKNEFNTIQKVAESRVKTLQTQYVKLGRDANGALKAIAVRPLALDMENLSTKTAIAAQKQQLFNQLIKQGSTNLLNFGKNTQWAGRQLMVGFSVPLAYLGTLASKTFMKMEEQAIRFKRVYGDSFTSSAETDKMIKQVQQLASEFTKYGVQVEKTMAMAADAAAMGKMGADLLAQINQATRLAVLGGVEQEKALETTISLTNAFGTSAEQLAGKINFLNAVENQTVTAIEDLTIAIPKAAPVIKQLGGSVEDLAFFLTAMKEGGINASEGANALKSGLASLINPTAKASEFMKGFGINIKGIVEANKGDVKGLVVEFATALDTLDPLNRARAIEQLFGKFQFSRLSTLFQNVIAEGSQAERVLKLSNATATELAILSERELKRVEDSPMYKFKKAVEDLKVSLVPLGEAFLKAITPLVEFAKGFLDKFNSMGEGAKNFAVIATTVVAGIGPVLLMTFGLIANGVANLIKMFSFISRTMSGAGKASTDLGSQTEYMTQQQLEAAAVASSLDQKHAKLIQTFNVEAAAVNKLATAYGTALVKQSRLLGLNPETGMPVSAGNKAPRPKKYNSGVISVPGPKGKGDIVPAMLAPGEAVIPADMAKKHRGFINDMINDNLPGYRFGRLGAFAGNIFGGLKKRIGDIPVMPGKNMPDNWNKLNPKGEWGLGESIVRTMFKKRGSYQGVSSTSIEDKLFDKFIRSPRGKKVAVRMFSDDFTGALGRGETRYQNVFERGTQSRGSLDTPDGKRMNAEQQLFGFGPDIKASSRPSYGYLFGKERGLGHRGGSLGDRLLSRITGKKQLGSDPYKFAKIGVDKATRLMNENTYRYGDIAMILKNKALRGRTTFTRGDSLNAFMNEYATPAKLATRNRDKIKAARTSRNSNEFFEAQIMGGFSFKDIKRIVATEPETILRVQQALKAAGIKGIRVGMPKYTMMQKLRKFVYGKKNASEQRLPRIQPESAGKYAGKYREDPFVLNGRTFWNKGGFVGNADAIKTFAKANGNMFSQGLDKNTKVTTASDIKVNGRVISFAGQDFPIKADKQDIEAKRVAESLAMLRSKGISDEKLLRRLKNLTDPNGQYPPRLTAEKLRENFGFKASGEPKSEGSKRGKGVTAATTDVAERRKHFDPLFRSEQLAMEKYAKKIGMSSSQLGDALGVHASHLVPEVDKNGNKIWNNFKNLIPDMGYINQFLNSFQKSNIAKDLATKSKAELDALGINKTELNKLIEGKHPTTTKAAETLRAVASYYSKNGPSEGGKQYAKLTAYGLGRRLKSKYYTKPIPTLAEAPVGKAATTTQAKPKPKPKPVPSPASAPVPVPAARQQSTGIKMSNLLRVARGGGAFAGILGMAGLAASMMGSFKQNQYNKGVVSVPGPKGAGDIVPAMLAPGEAVIPAAESKKYAPLIQQMVHGKIPGYFDSNVPKPSRPSIPGFDNTGMPLDPNGRQQISLVPQQSVPKLGDKIGAAFGASKTIAGAFVKGVGNVTKESVKIAGQIVASNAQEKALRMLGPGLGGYVPLKDGRIFDQVAQKTYADQASYDAAQKKIKEGKAAGTSYTTSSGRTYRFDDAGKAQRVTKEQLKMLGEERKAAEQKPKLGARIAGGLGTASMLGSTAGMGMMMSGDPGMQQMGGAVMMGSMILPMLPMLMNPLGLLAAGLAAAAAATLLVRGHFDKLGEETRKITSTLGVGTSAMQKYADFAGKVSASELMDKKRAAAFSPFSIQAGKNPFGAMFLQSEEGKGIIDSLKKARANGGDAQGVLFRQLSAAISGGSLDVKQARSIAFAIAESLGDQNLGMNINAKLTGLFGVNGENLLKDPLTVQVRQVAETSTDLQTSFDRFNDVGDVDFFSEEFAVNAGKAAAKARQEIEESGWGWTNTANDIAAWLNPISLIGKAVSGDANFSMTGLFQGLFGAGEEAIADSVEAANAYIVKASGAIENYQSAVDALDVNYDKQIEAAKAAGDQAKAEELIEKKAKARNDLMTKYAAAIKQVRDQFNAASETGQTTLLDAAEERLLERYKDSPDDRDLYKGARSKLEKNDISAGNQYSLNMLLNADAITLSTFDWISSNLDEPEITRVINLNTKLTGKDLGAATSLLNRFSGEKGRENFLAKFELAVDSNAAKDVLSTFTEIANLADTLGEENAQELMDFYVDPANEQKLMDLKANIDKIKEYDGEKLTVEYIQKIKGGDKFAKIIKGNQKYFDSLDKDQQVVYTQVVMTMAMSDPTQLQADADAWALQNGGTPVGSIPVQAQQSVKDANLKRYINNMAEQRTKILELLGLTEDGNGDPTDDGGEKENPFTDLLKKLRQIRNSALKVGGTLEETRKRFIQAMRDGAKTAEVFSGTDQKLLFSGYSTDFINAVNEMDEESRKDFLNIKDGVIKVTEAGKALNRYFSEIKLGDFQFSLASGVAAIGNQMKAMTKLTGATLSTSDAFEMVQDESLAYAIATAATDEEVQKLVDDFKKLQDAQQKFQFSTPEGTQDWLEEYSGEVDNAIGKVNEYFEAQRAIVEQDFENGDNKSGSNKDKLNIGLLADNITEAQDKIAEYQYDIDNLQYDLSTIADVEDKINEKYDEREEALRKIWDANSDIAEQQKAQLDIAQALASGDISAAARAMQEEQRRRAQKAKEDQEKALDLAREKELESVKSAKSKTRKQLEEEILQLTKKITTIEEDSLEPNERLLGLAESARDAALEAVGENGYLGQTEKAWGKIAAAARLAVVESDAFSQSLKNLMDAIPGFSVVDGKIVFDEAAFAAGIPGSGGTVTAPSGDGAGDGGGNGGGGGGGGDEGPVLNDKNSSYAVVANAKAGLYGDQPAAVSAGAGVTDPEKAKLAAIAAVRDGGFVAGGVTIKASSTKDFAKQVMDKVLQNRAAAEKETDPKKLAAIQKENMAIMNASGLKFAKGGMVPSYFGAGGFAKGTDTVPAMLTPGEFVMRRYAVDQYGTDTMKAINNGTFSGDSVYNYSVNVSVKSNANPDDIASAVMSRINQIDSQRIRSNRY